MKKCIYDKDNRLRIRVCERCLKCYKGTKYSHICPKCTKPNQPWSKGKHFHHIKNRVKINKLKGGKKEWKNK